MCTISVIVYELCGTPVLVCVHTPYVLAAFEFLLIFVPRDAIANYTGESTALLVLG